jgi:hypothetical protein
MAFGFKSYDAAGNLIYSTEDATWTLLAVKTAPANVSKTFTNIPEMPTRKVSRLMINEVTGDTEAYVHTVTLAGGTLTATRPSSTNTSTTLLMVFGK